MNESLQVISQEQALCPFSTDAVTRDWTVQFEMLRSMRYSCPAAVEPVLDMLHVKM